ncbi:DUF3757 domain-containing protein [Pseudomonas sp. BJa5]|uniref:DUF3757 domain-containing protein n=1 Tax=Pseudomonas sp. BJa5 TaxID=2936270 RepID=UPI00255A0431|nr:DUF3757 domain-containing protein [Pseudomonas sp. BGr12]MDL2423499.1 DUF3757 domain-containing protein [Pseudomonas sp. BGr12]
MPKAMIATLLIGFMSAAPANAGTCPAAASISQAPKGLGFSYSAPGGWEGESPSADEGDLKTFTFANASIKSDAVVCKYKGDNQSSISLTLKKSVMPVGGSSWQGGTCAGSDPAECAFD